MEKDGIDNKQSLAFCERTGKKERTIRRKRVSCFKERRRYSYTAAAIGAFLIAPSVSFIFLWLLELWKLPSEQLAWKTAVDNALVSEDFIFLVFSLVLAVILEWIIRDDKSGDKLYVSGSLIWEVIFLVISIALYIFEKVTIYNQADSAIMEYRCYFHFTLMLSAILVSMIGYYNRLSSKD